MKLKIVKIAKVGEHFAGLLTLLFKSMAIIDSDTVENSIADTDTHAKKCH